MLTFSFYLFYLFFRQEPRPGHSHRGVRPPTPSCSTAPGPRHQRAACSTYSTHLFRHAIRGSTKKKDLRFFLFYYFFHEKSLQHYEGVQRTILKTNGLLWEKVYCLDYIQYIICFLFFCL